MFQNPAYHKYAKRIGSASDHNNPPTPNPVSEAKHYCRSYGFLAGIGLTTFQMGIRHHYASQSGFFWKEEAYIRFAVVWAVSMSARHNDI